MGEESTEDVCSGRSLVSVTHITSVVGDELYSIWQCHMSLVVIYYGGRRIFHVRMGDTYYMPVGDEGGEEELLMYSVGDLSDICP